MQHKITILIKRVTGGLLCIFLAALFVLFQTWLILELRNEPQIVTGNAYSMASIVPPAGQYESWEYWARADEAWRNESMRTTAAMQDELSGNGFEYGQSGDDQSP